MSAAEIASIGLVRWSEHEEVARAVSAGGPSLVEVPIDYAENLRLTEHLGALSGGA